jgi:hypothetical protein
MLCRQEAIFHVKDTPKNVITAALVNAIKIQKGIPLICLWEEKTTKNLIKSFIHHFITHPTKAWRTEGVMRITLHIDRVQRSNTNTVITEQGEGFPVQLQKPIGRILLKRWELRTSKTIQTNIRSRVPVSSAGICC